MISLAFFIILSLLFNFNLTNHRLAISGEDVIFNDINNAYSQSEIAEIASIKVMFNGKDITDNLILYENNYLGNENNVGMYTQIYRITVNNNFEGEMIETTYEYVLTIYNSDLKVKTYELNTNVMLGNYLTVEDFRKLINNELNITVRNIEEISNNYQGSEHSGSYYVDYLVTDANNRKVKVTININVIEEETIIPIKFIIIATSTLLVVAIIIINIIKRRKKK